MRCYFLLLVALSWPVRGQNYQELMNSGDQALTCGDYQAAVKDFPAAYEIARTTIIEPTATHQIFVRQGKRA